MIILRMISNIRSFNMFRFGNRTWLGTPFSSHEDFYTDSKNMKVADKKSGEEVLLVLTE